MRIQSLALALVCVAVPAAASVDTARFDTAVQEAIKKYDVPGASVAVVADGRIAYVKALGKGKLDPDRPADAAARYKIASISKQFLAAAMLMLQEDGKLSLDDKVGKYIPDLGPAGEATLRQLLSHTAGIRDYYPQDYLFTAMKGPVTPAEIVARWARQPLDYPPGERYQYSNTGYVLAAMVLEKVTGEKLFSFLKRRIFVPLNMTSAFDSDAGALSPSDATGYSRYLTGPYRAAGREGHGWMFGAGELAMTADDLARWDVSIINRSLLRPESYRQFEQEVMLNTGVGAHYALGLDVKMNSERRVLSHGGEVAGFLSTNVIYPDQRAAIVVLVNSDSADAGGAIVTKLTRILFESISPVDQERLAAARRLFDSLRDGRIDRSLLSPNGSDYFTADAVRDYQASLAPLGAVKSFDLVRAGTRGGMDFRIYRVVLEKETFTAIVRTLPDGKMEQFMLSPE